MKTCVHCGIEKGTDEFYAHGHTKDRLCSWCKACHRAYQSAPEYRGGLRDAHKKDPRRQMLSDAKRRALKFNLPYNITKEYVHVPDVCPILGIPLFVNGTKSTPNSPSIDRIRPELGYVKGNVAVISYRANAIKNDATLREILLVASYLKKFEDKTKAVTV